MGIINNFKDEMTPKERSLAYANNQEVDRIPTVLTCGETIPPLYNIKMKDYYFSSELMFQVEKLIASDFGSDNMGMGLGLRTIAESLGTKLKYTDNSVSYIDKPLIDDYKILDNLEFTDINKDGRLPIMLEAFKRLQDEYGNSHNIGTGAAGPLSTAAALRGTELLLKDTRKNKENLHKLLKFTTDNFINCAKQFYEQYGICMSISEPIASGSLISRKQFIEFELPYLKTVCSELEKIYKKAPSLHICGKTNDRWDLIAESGISSFSIDDCENMKSFKEEYGDKVGLSGNVRPVEIIKFGNVKEIEESVKSCIIDAGDNPKGFTLSPGCTTPMYTSKENLMTYMNAARKYGRRAKKGYIPRGTIENGEK